MNGLKCKTDFKTTFSTEIPIETNKNNFCESCAQQKPNQKNSNKANIINNSDSSFPGVTVKDMKHCKTFIIFKKPDNNIMSTGTDNTRSSTSRHI